MGQQSSLMTELSRRPASRTSSTGKIGTIRRRKYDPATGEACWFVSGWDSHSPLIIPADS
jgi:hypothetical protein